MTNESTHPPVPENIAERKLEDVVNPRTLQMLNQSTGFIYREDPNADTAYTIGKTINFPPWMIRGDAERGLKPIDRLDGVLFHEGGHHAPAVVLLQDKITDHLTKIDIPPSYRGDPQSEERFISAVWQNVGNATADIWLEAYVSRMPYVPIREAIKGLYAETVKTDEQFISMNRPSQLMHALLEIRFNPDRDYSKILKPEVYDEFLKLIQGPTEGIMSPLEVLMDDKAFGSFATPGGIERAIENKFSVYKDFLLPAYLKLLTIELQERKEQKNQQNQGGKGNGKGSLIDRIRSASGGNSSAPMTKEEAKAAQEAIEEIIQELEKQAAEHSKTQTKEEREAEERARNGLKTELKRRREQGKIEKGPEPQKEKSGMEEVAELAEKLRKQSKSKRQRGLAEDYKVREETIRRWEEIKESRRMDIENLAASLAEIFLEDRRSRRDMLHREGIIVEGLEYETMAGILSGDPDPQTNYKIMHNPQFLETEIEFVMDTSGSMLSGYLKNSVETMVVITEAFRRCHQTMADEGLVQIGEYPLRVGETIYDVNPKRVTKLTDPISDEKEIAMIEYSSKVGGGTDETEAIETVAKELSLGESHIIKILVLLTDGHGNTEGIAPIMRQIEDDDQIAFLAIGVGPDGMNVVNSYLIPVQDRENSNVAAFEVEDPSDILPQTVEFLRKEVYKRKAFR